MLTKLNLSVAVTNKEPSSICSMYKFNKFALLITKTPVVLNKLYLSNSKLVIGLISVAAVNVVLGFTILKPKTDSKKTAIIDVKYQEIIPNDQLVSQGSINLKSYSPNKIIYNVNTEENGLAVFSEIFYPKGWQAYIDGIAVHHFPVNYILRGLVVPSSAREVIFEFKPKSFFVSAKISFLASCLLIITGLITFVRLVLYKK